MWTPCRIQMASAHPPSSPSWHTVGHPVHATVRTPRRLLGDQTLVALVTGAMHVQEGDGIPFPHRYPIHARLSSAECSHAADRRRVRG